MSYIRAKKIKGKTYYYLVKSQRVDGRVKQVFVKYLGVDKPSKKESELVD